MTETTDKTREELEAELESLRAQQRAIGKVAPELSTRELSPAKPQDHKPADAEKQTFTFYGIEVEISRRMINDWRLQLMIGRTQKGDISAAGEILDFLIGAEKHAAIIESIVQSDGWCDSEKIQQVTKELFEAFGAGN